MVESTLYVVNVFVGPDGTGGNPLGVFMAEPRVPLGRRQEIAADLGFSETVFLEDNRTAELEIYTPQSRLQFAGHPLVGTAGLMRRMGLGVSSLKPPVGEVSTWVRDELIFIRGRAEWATRMEFRQLDSAHDVTALEGPPDEVGFLYAWAWENEAAGQVRARVFAPEHGIAEDEATGSGAIALAAMLGRPLRILQGKGSVLLVEPSEDGWIDLGGRVDDVEERPYNIGG